MLGLWLNRIRRGFRRSPQELQKRLVLEVRALRDRYRVSPTFGIDDGHFVRQFGVSTIEDLWRQLSGLPYPTVISPVDRTELDATVPNESQRILAAADTAMALQVDLLGSGPETLSRPILWDTDFKTEQDWPIKFFRDIDILNPERDSDVKVPWELSRLQWLIPVGQAYLLTGDDKYANFTREVLSDWMEANPYGHGVNWTIAMEAAMRIFTWTWLFHVFKNSSPWDDYEFRSKFLRTIYEHGVFTERYLEDFGGNGNHCTADAAALVFIGLFFGEGKAPARWQSDGWQILHDEMPRQILDDGTDFEGSIAYHRFVAELFFWPARYRRVVGLEVPQEYHRRLAKMAEFTLSYTRQNGLAPLWGDSDDGRVLPFGGQNINDHSYLSDILNEGSGCGFVNVAARGESFWIRGPNASVVIENNKPASRSFENSGYYIMSTPTDHVFIDCGPIGFDGRGGHGHNDCLSFGACLNGQSLISDSGSFVYSASPEQRNLFRSTASHNTPMIDDEEINRFVSEDELFAFQNDAVPEVREWQCSDHMDVFIGSHSGYERLEHPVKPVRKIVLDKLEHRLIVADTFEGEGDHTVRIPFHFSPDCVVTELESHRWSIIANDQKFEFVCRSDVAWQSSILRGWISPSYGVKEERLVIEFSRQGQLASLIVGLYPTVNSPESPTAWLLAEM